jgi:hypothetical protein
MKWEREKRAYVKGKQKRRKIKGKLKLKWQNKCKRDEIKVERTREG